MKKCILAYVLCVLSAYSVHATDTTFVMPDPDAFALELNAAPTQEYIPEKKPWLLALATSCAERMPEPVMAAVVSAYCTYDSVKEWLRACKPRLAAYIERIAYGIGKKNAQKK